MKSRKEKYIEYINSEEWRQKREQTFLHRGVSCQKCGNTSFLQVHHGTYRNLFKEKLSDLFVLCNSCHFDFHQKYGTKDLFRATKAFIKGIELIPRKKKKRLPLEERKKRREERKALEIPKAIEAIKNGIKFSKSGVFSMKNWRKALIIIKNEKQSVLGK